MSCAQFDRVVSVCNANICFVMHSCSNNYLQWHLL